MRPLIEDLVLTDEAVAYCAEHGHALRWERTHGDIGSDICQTCGWQGRPRRQEQAPAAPPATPAPPEDPRSAEESPSAVIAQAVWGPPPTARPGVCRRDREIRELAATGLCHREIAQIYELTVARVWQICRGWKPHRRKA